MTTELIEKITNWLLEIVDWVVKNPEFLTAIAAIVALLWTILNDNRQSLLQTVTVNRIDWLNQVRQLLGDFAHAYWNGELKRMIEIEARLELFMRIDKVEYQPIFNHMKHCMKNQYCENDYDRFLLLASAIIVRTWQRIKVDVNYPKSDIKTQEILDEKVQVLLNMAESCNEGE